jgi:hypothetical protein
MYEHWTSTVYGTEPHENNYGEKKVLASVHTVHSCSILYGDEIKVILVI